MSTRTKIIICIICTIVIGLALGLGLGLGLKDDKKGSGSAAVPAAAASTTTSPRATLLATGQAIQVAEAEISTSPPTFTPPTGIDRTKVSYTMSMDVLIAQTGPSWRNIMNNGTHDCCDATSRRPAVFITGSDAAPPNRIHIVHGANEDNNKNIVTSFAATLGTYFNVTWVVDGGKLTTYINGTKDSAGTVSGTFNWGTHTPTWKWNQYLSEYTTRTQNTAGSVKVKNAYWFNKALTDAEITTLTTAGTTSTYAPEPYSLF